MNPIKIAHVFGWICVLALVVLSLLPGSERPHTGVSGHTEHFMAYAGTGLMLAIGARWRVLLASALGLSILSGLMEVAQLWIPGRTGEFAGFFYSSLGAVVGLLVGAAATRALRAAGYRRLADRSTLS